jgi:hypothetical protein
MEGRVVDLMDSGYGQLTVVMITGIEPWSFTKSGGCLDWMKKYWHLKKDST